MTTMKRYPLLLIALVASVLICIQNLSILGGFVWALIHGAGARSFVAFVPAALALVVLWAGYRVIRSRVTGRYMTFAFLAYAIGVVVLNEMLLPATPLKDWSGRRALEGVRVLGVRDEPLLSARGNPIGVRISFDGVVQRTDAYLIAAATLASASGETIWPLSTLATRLAITSSRRRRSRVTVRMTSFRKTSPTRSPRTCCRTFFGMTRRRRRCAWLK